jgi:hypothetical protein
VAWGRFGDTVGMYPRLLAAVAREDAPDGAYPMMFGFLCLLAASSTAHSTDYVVGIGNVQQAGAGHWRWLLDAACKSGLLKKHRRKVHGLDAYVLIDDPAFIHIRLKAEIDWENQQRSDTENLRISVPVRLRDGDLCRYCGVVVHWRGPTSTKSGRKGTYDHLEPGKAATVDTMVVACLSCNSEIRDKHGEDRKPLQPVPAAPFYGSTTAKFLTMNGHPTRPTSADDLDAVSDPAPAGHRAASPARQRPAKADTAQAGPPADSDPAPAGHRAAGTAVKINSPPESPTLATTPVVEESDPAGSGRDGTGNRPLLPNSVTGDLSRRRRSSRSSATRKAATSR